MPDLNTYDLEGAKAQVAGTARSMGIEVGLTTVHTPPSIPWARPGRPRPAARHGEPSWRKASTATALSSASTASVSTPRPRPSTS